jgi:hypothetical protein
MDADSIIKVFDHIFVELSAAAGIILWVLYVLGVFDKKQ